MTAQFILNKKRLTDQAVDLSSIAPVIAVVKNDAYNHGLKDAFESFYAGGIRSFATTSLKEAVRLRSFNQEIMILLLDPSTDFETLKKYSITLTIPSLSFYHKHKEDLKGLTLQLVFKNKLNRLGFNGSSEMKAVLEESSLTINGLWTHFAFAYDGDSDRYTHEVNAWKHVLQELKDYLPSLPYIHAQNSASFYRDGLMPGHTHIRVGALLYGTRPIDQPHAHIHSRQAVRVDASVVEVTRVKAGDSAGYSAAFKATKDTCLAICSIGYGNGLLKERAHFPVAINGNLYPIRVLMMSHLLVEVDETVSIGDHVILYDDSLSFESFTRQGIGAFSEQMAAFNRDTFSYQVID